MFLGARASAPANQSFPTVAELRAQVPPAGCKTNVLLNKFKGRINGDDRQKAFMLLLKQQTKFDPVTKLVILKPENAKP